MLEIQTQELTVPLIKKLLINELLVGLAPAEKQELTNILLPAATGVIVLAIIVVVLVVAEIEVDPLFCTTCKILPAWSFTQLRLPLPSVFSTCPAEPSATGNLNVQSALLVVWVRASSATDPPDCAFNFILILCVS